MNQYYLYINGEIRGPFSIDDLKQFVAQGVVTSESYIWYEGLSDWRAASIIEGLFAEQSSQEWKQVSKLEVAVERREKIEGEDKKREAEDKISGKKLTSSEKITASIIILLILAVAIASPFLVKYFSSRVDKSAITATDTGDDSDKTNYNPYPFDATLWEPGKLLVSFIDVGQGDAVFIRTPGDKRIVLDSGMGIDKSRFSFFDQGEKVVQYLNAQNIRTLDYVIMSHPHFDHCGGLMTVMKKMPFPVYIDPKPENIITPEYEQLLRVLKTLDVKYRPVRRGQRLHFDDKIEALVLSPKTEPRGTNSDANNVSIVLKLIYGKISFLLAGDIEQELEREVTIYVKDYLKSTVLKVPHHGSATSSTARFLKCVDPDYAVICVGAKNSFGHPKPEVLERYKEMFSKKFFNPEKNLLRTDMHGTIEFYTDGEKLTVRTEKQADPKLVFEYLSPYRNITGKMININTASLEELQNIPGVGPTIAQKIIDYRKKKGRFKNKEEIKNVAGVGDKTYQKMKTWITTE
ncbi:MAG: helix-hairpin-helix domain-containing protein [Candidatus Hydrogenedentota bacterium]